VAGVAGQRVRPRHSVAHGQPEVGDQHARAVDQDVAGLDVAMDDPGGVCGGEAVRDRGHHGHDLTHRPRLRATPRPQRHPGDVLHRDEQVTAHDADVVHRHHVRVR